MRDLMNSIHPLRAISPQAAVTDNTALVSQIIDVRGYDSLTFVILSGGLTDPNATFSVLVEHGSDSGLSDAAAVADDDLLGTEALAGMTYADDNETRKIGYVGSKRYVRLTVTPSGNDSGNVFVSAVAVLGHPRMFPTPNPPV
ncbi:hypothetical protein J2848_005692 [Azospirillum lipoferum]|uniref:Uncharacterized protein n=1 Tax=Azospirillum lipoferum TaxID=193 RepID=A0A5A9GGV0_AZOLI|nr:MULTISPECIES: hypothetical protein [Azospirillum]KAA0592952.1 hypothetical protein FZ942_25855 [Azospirillum lipoferum]MCP1613991.1 hypothetical protein [Azospirillum lipoferum]MDW5537617.1 hypothetical protein [Azospirillum sp. NL1]